ncbi:MAG: hypothetical protein IJ303_02810, partial [Clostridia bacterium]|nr:hypothetical protein [Clostridia bacterium]
MIKDPIIKIFVLSKRLWREIKKPVIRTRLAGKFSILQSREAPESNEKKAVFHTTFDLSIAK